MKPVRFAALIGLCISVLLVFPRSGYSVQKYTHYLQKPGVISQCPDLITQDSSANYTTQTIHPVEVVVRPWQGRHHVYGVFVLPPGYEPSQVFQVSLEGAGSYCGRLSGLGSFAPDLSAKLSNLLLNKPQSDRVVVGHLRTRTALWLLSKGQHGQLNRPQNWSLEVEKPI